MNREFVAKLPRVGVLRKILESIDTLIDRFNLDITANGIEMLSLDSAHVAFARLLIPADSFTEFRTPRNFSMGFKCDQLITVLKCGSTGCPVELRGIPDGDYLDINFTDQGSSVDKHIPLKLQNVDDDRQNIPVAHWPFQVTMPSTRIQGLLDEISSLKVKEVTVSVTSQALKLTFQSEIIADGAAYMISADESVEIICPEGGVVAQTFALKYLASFLKAASVAPSVVVCMAEDLPILIKLAVPDVGMLEWFLAAKVDEDEGANLGMQD